jgi:hypothetical protein
VINVVQWESIEASRAIHRNPEIVAGFASYQELDVEMDLRYYEVALTVGQLLTTQDHSALMAQVDVLYVTPENQQRLLDHLIQYPTPVLPSQAEDQSIVWLRSLDGIQVIRLLYLHNGHDHRNTELSFNQFSTNETWIKQIDTSRYQIECCVEKHSLLI